MVRKQLQGLGCPLSVDFSEHTSQRISLQFVCTDAGPDQKAFRLGWNRSGGSGFDNLDFSFWISRRLHHAPYNVFGVALMHRMRTTFAIPGPKAGMLMFIAAHAIYERMRSQICFYLIAFRQLSAVVEIPTWIPNLLA
jgi:hypothetical protein